MCMLRPENTLGVTHHQTPFTFHFVFWDGISIGIWSSLIWLGCLASEPQRSSHHHPQHWDYKHDTMPGVLCRCWRSFCLHSKHFTNRSIFPTLIIDIYCVFISFFKWPIVCSQPYNRFISSDTVLWFAIYKHTFMTYIQVYSKCHNWINLFSFINNILN